MNGGQARDGGSDVGEPRGTGDVLDSLQVTDTTPVVADDDEEEDETWDGNAEEDGKDSTDHDDGKQEDQNILNRYLKIERQ